MSEAFIRHDIQVEAPVETLWKVLTDNESIQQYMFGCYADTDWKPGSPLLWKGAADGKVYVTGHVVTFDAPHLLAYTTFDPNSTITNIPANYLTMTFRLTERGAQSSTLEISQGDYSKVENGENRYKDSLGGGHAILDSIKKLAEAVA